MRLFHSLQDQQLDLMKELMDEWTKVGDIISDLLELNQKIMIILKEGAEEK